MPNPDSRLTADMLTAATFMRYSPGFGRPAMLDFRDPDWSQAAFTADAVIPLLARAEAEAKMGRYVVVALSYEAAPAFDSAMVVHEAGDFPLAVAAAFEGLVQDEIHEANEDYELGQWHGQISKDVYHDAIAAIQEYILAGDVYQVNFTYQQTAVFHGSGRAWLRALGAMPQGGFHAWLDLGECEVVSPSPELFFASDGGRIWTRPMKGTLPRGRWLEEDDEQVARLMASAKNRAENVMIVDLLRNDLGRIARTGSVKVADLFTVERYPGALQMTSTVEAQLRDEASLPEIMGALFPCGSITGAPKIRAMQIIRELEPRPRGLYTGTIGLLEPDGRACFSVAIRTATIDKRAGRAVCGVGGGITHDSEAEDEHRESVLKTAFLMPQPEFNLFETILCDEGAWFLLEGHLRRLSESARFFGFEWSEEAVRAALQESMTSDRKSGRWRVRLILYPFGCKASVEWSEIPDAPPQKSPWRVALAPEPVNSRDVFLYHKTTRREVYDRARASRAECDDVILWNERGEVTETTIANVALASHKGRVTPPRRCGLLGGVMRRAMLDEGAIKEGIIRRDELTPGRAVTLINSVRGEIPAVIVE